METEGYFRRNRSEDLGQIPMNLYPSLSKFEYSGGDNTLCPRTGKMGKSMGKDPMMMVNALIEIVYNGVQARREQKHNRKRAFNNYE